jgi:glycosyltransferase involved in cell wall biosynthesis
LDPQKGVGDLIKAFSLIKYDNTELWIVGYGPQENELKVMAASAHVKSRIKFFGFISPKDLPSIYKQANIFVHPGVWPEPFGRTIMEAMLAKLAVIASNVGAPPDIIDDTGLVYESGDVKELSRKLELLIQDHAFTNALGTRAYDRAKKNFDPEQITLRIINEYKNFC